MHVHFAARCMWSTHMASLVWNRWKKAAWLLLWCIHGKWGMNVAQFGIWLLGNNSKTPVNVNPPRAARLFWLSWEMQDFKWVEKHVVQGEKTSQTPQPLIHLGKSSCSGLERQDPLIIIEHPWNPGHKPKQWWQRLQEYLESGVISRVPGPFVFVFFAFLFLIVSLLCCLNRRCENFQPELSAG